MSATPDTSTQIPRPRHRIPLLGDVLSLDPIKPVQKETRMAAELGPLFERTIVGQRLLVVSGVDLVREVNDERYWARSLGAPILKLRKIAGDGLFTAFNSEPAWSKAHNILAAGFSQSALRTYHGSMNAVIDELVAKWDAAAESGSTVDVSRDMTSLAFEIIGRAGFGYEFGSFRGVDDPFVGAMERTLAYVNRSSNDIPLVRAIFGRRAHAQYRRDVQYLRDVVDGVVAERAAEKERRQGDLLDLMLHETDPESGEQLTQENIRNQVLTFLIAGNETTAGTLAFALHFLSQHPEIADRARQEVESVVGAEPQDIAFEQVAKLRYLRRIVDETLRLWPTAPGYFRKVREDTVLGGRYPMPKGSWVFVLLPALHRDPVWGPEPEKFDPDRFLPDAVRARDKDAYRPFGTGPRACIGRQFALHEAILALAAIVQRYEVQPLPDYVLDVREAITLKPQGLKVRLNRR